MPIRWNVKRRKAPPLYALWANMRDRCENPNCKDFSRYGGRGIIVCSRWRSFANFVEDMAPRPPGTTLDRIDNDGPYAPENCRWATISEQANNRRTCLRFTHNGETATLAQWARKIGVKPQVMKRRLERWPLERALSEPVNAEKRAC